MSKYLINSKCLYCRCEFCYQRSAKRKYCSLKCSTDDSKTKRLGENNPAWKGISGEWAYSNLHKWINRHYGIATKCENQECEGKSKHYEWSNISGIYERDINNYRQLCKSCHIRFDKKTNHIKLKENETYTSKNETGDKYKPLLQKVC